MKKEEILKELTKHNSTVLSFPDRGQSWGDNHYRGNCSGWIHASLINKYDVKKLAELFAGGGTGSDVAKDMGIAYIGADLNPKPVRSNILTIDALVDEVPDEFRDADMLFMHPPYSELIHIPYAGSMYPDPTGELSKSDLGQMPWNDFMKALNSIIMKYYAAMPSGGKMSILMGNVRRNGHYYSMMKDVVVPGELIQTLVKIQHNCVSNGRTYANSNFYPTDHEDIIVIKKPGGYIIAFKTPVKKEIDVRDSKKSTWKDVVYTVLSNLGRSATLSEIYKAVEGHEKCKHNPNWQAKIRQTLQQGGFNHIAEGVWAA